MRWGRHGGDHRSLIALTAICALILQSYFFAWAAAAPPAHPVDAFGNPLCVTSTDDGAGAPGQPHDVADCCALGCGAVATLAVARGAAGGEPILWPLDGQAPAPRTDPPIPMREPGHDPGSPRAPPVTT